MGKRIPPLRIKIMLESNPLKSRILVRRLAVLFGERCWVPALHVEVPEDVVQSLEVLVVQPRPVPLRGWRSTVEIVVLLEISSSMKARSSVFRAYTSKSEPVIGFSEPKQLDEAAKSIPPTSRPWTARTRTHAHARMRMHARTHPRPCT